MNYHTEQKHISIPIPAKFRNTALKFAQEQPNQRKAKQVYLNSLVVQVVDSYLQMLDIPTNLEASYSWNTWSRILGNIADLVLPGIGHLECRYTRTGEEVCHIPHEVWDNRFGYIFVEVNKSCTEAKIRGFLPQINSLEINLKYVQTINEFLEYYHQFSIVKLRHWLEGIYTSQWQNFDDFALQKTPQFAFRSQKIRGLEIDTPQKVWQIIQQLYPQEILSKLLPTDLVSSINKLPDSNIDLTEIIINLLRNDSDEELRWTLAEILWTIAPKHPLVAARRIMDLGMQLAGNAVALMVAVLPKQDQSFAVLLRVYPMGNQPYLPTGLQLAGLYENGQPFLEVEARESKDNYIQLKFCAEINEKFQIRVKIGDVSITEKFII